MIPQPIGDKITVRAINPPGKIGFIHIPEHTKTQATITHYKGVVLAAGPKAKDLCPAGTIVHLHEAFGERVSVGGKDFVIGRLRDVNAILEGETLEDNGTYQS